MLGKVLKLEVQLKLLPRAIVQPTPLSALLDRPGLQLLYCLIRAGRLGWEKRGFMGPFTRAPPRSTIHTRTRNNQPESLETIESILSCTFDLSMKYMHLLTVTSSAKTGIGLSVVVETDKLRVIHLF